MNNQNKNSSQDSRVAQSFHMLSPNYSKEQNIQILNSTTAHQGQLKEKEECIIKGNEELNYENILSRTNEHLSVVFLQPPPQNEFPVSEQESIVSAGSHSNENKKSQFVDFPIQEQESKINPGYTESEQSKLNYSIGSQKMAEIFSSINSSFSQTGMPKVQSMNHSRESLVNKSIVFN